MPPESMVIRPAFGCWITQFKKYVEDHGRRFPILPQHFNKFIADFSDTRPEPDADMYKRQFWMRCGTLKASFMPLEIDMDRRTDSNIALVLKKKWDRYLGDWRGRNTNLQNVAFHTSSLWVLSEANVTLVYSTGVTFIIVILLSFMG